VYFGFSFSIEGAVEVWDRALAEVEGDANRALDTLHQIMLRNEAGWNINYQTLKGLFEHFDRLTTCPTEDAEGNETRVVEPVHLRLSPSRKDSVFHQERYHRATELALARNKVVVEGGTKTKTKQPKSSRVKGTPKNDESEEEEVEEKVNKYSKRLLTEEEAGFFSLPVGSGRVCLAHLSHRGCKWGKKCKFPHHNMADVKGDLLPQHALVLATRWGRVDGPKLSNMGLVQAEMKKPRVEIKQAPVSTARGHGGATLPPSLSNLNHSGHPAESQRWWK
jgi:hypothetical protein